MAVGSGIVAVGACGACVAVASAMVADGLAVFVGTAAAGTRSTVLPGGGAVALEPGFWVAAAGERAASAASAAERESASPPPPNRKNVPIAEARATAATAKPPTMNCPRLELEGITGPTAVSVARETPQVSQNRRPADPSRWPFGQVSGLPQAMQNRFPSITGTAQWGQAGVVFVMTLLVRQRHKTSS